MPQRPAPPKVTRQEAEDAFTKGLNKHWPTSHNHSALFLMRYFTTIDLQLITEELENAKAPPYPEPE